MEVACWSSHGHENHGGGNWLHSAAEIQLTPNSPVNRIKEYSTSIICSSRLENIWQVASYLTNEHTAYVLLILIQSKDTLALQLAS